MKALIVDESGRTAPRLRTALSEEGYLVDTAHERGEAMWLAGESAPDVVVVCSARPGVHDVPTISALRDDGEAAPILVMARRGESADTVAALDAGADDVVVSPVPFTEVAARIRALTRRAPALVEPDLEVGTLRLDRAARLAVRTIDREGEPQTHEVALTSREYGVLELLMRHPGQVMTRTRIDEAVWGPSETTSSNLVDQVVSRLRAKLDRPFGCRSIVTVRGVGYRLVESPSGTTSLVVAC